MARFARRSRWGFLITPKWLGWHLLVFSAIAGMLVLGNWQLRRAEGGNALSWGYTFEWPIFAVFALVFWIKTIRDEVRPPARRGPAGQDVLPSGALTPSSPAAGAGAGPAGEPQGSSEEEAELAAYNAYLARLTREVKGHGRWHGLR